jgi:hypothetical protein
MRQIKEGETMSNSSWSDHGLERFPFKPKALKTKKLEHARSNDRHLATECLGPW